MVEYALILALVAIAVIAALTTFGRGAADMMSNDQNSITAAMSGGSG